jgi:hypothetical protein
MLNMIYKNIYKLFLILFIQIFYIKLNEIKKEKLYIKYNQLNKIKNILRQKEENIYKYNIKSIKMIKKVVYSVIIGDYDNISPFPIQEGFDYFLFSDVIYNNTNWTIIPISTLIKKENISSLKMTRYVKLFPNLFFKDYELSIYFDASYIINGDLNELLLRILNPSYDLYFLQHPVRNTIFEEFLEVINSKKETNESVFRVKNRYIKENFPDNLGLTENCIIIRRHNRKNIIKLMEFWWKEIKNYSYRDQLSLNYAIWKLNMTFKIYYLPKRFMIDYLSFTEHSKIVEY